MCETTKTCPDYCKTYKIEFNDKGHVKGRKHKCGWSKCEFCLKHVNLSQHLCYIQPVDEDEDLPKNKCVPLSEVGGRSIVDDEPNEFGNVLVEKEPPLFVYEDYEATTNADGIQSPILVGYETSESDVCHLIYGPNCTDEFFEALENLAVDMDGNDRQVIVLFHNLKGYHGVFLIKYCYDHHHEVSNLVTVGAKILSVPTDSPSKTRSASYHFLSLPYHPLLDSPNFVKVTSHISSTRSRIKPIRTIHEVWHFPPAQQKTGLFKHYVNTRLKIKTEASGYPSCTDTPAKKEEYVTNYKQREGIDLDPALIAKNPGRKATAQLMLNSFWGKFAENMRKSKTATITTPADLYSLILDPLINIKHSHP